MPETGTKARSSSTKSIELALGSVLGSLAGEIAVFIVAVFDMPLYLPSAQPIGPSDTLQQGHSMQSDFRVKHPRLYRPGRNDTAQILGISSATLPPRSKCPEFVQC